MTDMQRLRAELQKMACVPGIKVRCVNGNLLDMHVSIKGAAGTAFENGVFHYRFDLTGYPAQPPTVTALHNTGYFSQGSQVCIPYYTHKSHQSEWSVSGGRMQLDMVANAVLSFMLEDDGQQRQVSSDQLRVVGQTKSYCCPECGMNHGSDF